MNENTGHRVHPEETDLVPEDLLAPARRAATRLQRNSTSSGLVLILLGIVQAALVTLVAPRFWGAGGWLSRTIVLIPLVLFVIHAARRPVKPRHHGGLHGVLGAAIAAVISLAITVGWTSFPDSVRWWVGMGIASSVPYFCAVYFEYRHRLRITKTLVDTLSVAGATESASARTDGTSVGPRVSCSNLAEHYHCVSTEEILLE